MTSISELDELNDFYKQCMDKCHEWGLSPFETDFHVVPSHRIYEIASYGLPGHFSHWSYGRDYWKQKTQYDHGYGRIYELVINADPSQAFLLDTNSLLDNQFVIAHVLGHTHFFANNAYFEHTNRNIEVTTATAADRFREYEIKYGRSVVEDFIDDVFAIKEHIDPHLLIKRKGDDYELSFDNDPYLDLFPDEVARRKSVEESELLRKESKFPSEPQKDLLYFIAQNARLKDWQRDIVMTIRDEMIYFLPQMQTKIMNEGWASIMHNKLMHELDPESDPGGIDFADVHSGVLSSRLGALNPYWLGYNIYKRIIEIGNEELDDKTYLGAADSPGWLEALDIVSVERDESFLRNHVDEVLCERLDLFTFEFDKSDASWWISDKEWERVRDELVAGRANMGMPYIEVTDGDLNGTGNLELTHRYDGRPLDFKWAAKTMQSVARLWNKGVMLVSVEEHGTVLVSVEKPNDPAVLTTAEGGVKLIK